MVDLTNLNAEVKAIGLLIGLLTESGETISVTAGWFGSAESYLEDMDQRFQQVVLLLEAIMKPAVVVDPVPSGSSWYQIPNPGATGSEPTVFPVYVVVVPEGDTSSVQLGLGLRATTKVDGLTVDATIYLPVLTYDASGTRFVAGTAGYPCQPSITITGDQPFTASNATFSGITIAGQLNLDGTAPSLSLHFNELTPTTLANRYTSLTALNNEAPLAWLAAVVLQGARWLDSDIGSSKITPGTILVAAGLLTQNSTKAYVVSGASWSNPDAVAIVENFVFSLLNAFASATTPVPIVTLPPSGGLYVCSRPGAGNSTDYGLRLALDVDLGAQVVLCLGTGYTGENKATDWIKDSSPDQAALFPEAGISLYLLSATTPAPAKLSFASDLVVVNAGVNISGADSAPLVDVRGYTLGGAELRFALARPAGSNWVYGVASKLDGLGIPLGPGFDAAASSAGTNPVAKSLVAGGSSTGTGDQDPVNPAFSVSAAYVAGGKLAVQLYDKDDKPADTVTLPINRALGPLQCEKLGIGWLPEAPNGPTLSLLFDGGVKLDVLDISLSDLTIGVPLKFPGDFTKYDLDLGGLGLSFSAGEVSLSGAFDKLPPDPTAKPARLYPEYDGSVLIKAGTFSLTALGSYAYVTGAQPQNGFASMFIFGALNGTIGGPAFFFVTGLAAGFGYNRQILLPTMSTVTEFPLVQMLSETSPPTDPSAVLLSMESDVPPQRGEYWLAAGVNFTSFDLLKTSALVTVEFGQELEIALLGQTAMSLPPPPPGATDPVTYAYLELGIEVIVLPDTGSVAATALLTSNSYVIDPACKLTGGFALSAWFGDNPHAGEFVVTVGGYHPAFTPPSYYPVVPRLAFNWPVTGNLTISGDAYFALTPSAAMAGGGLNIVYSSGNLRAWFTAQMDALIYWAPFQYNIGISVDLGASYKMDLWFTTVTLSIELGATLTVWGPPMGGTASISWFVISFTIGFGANPPASAQWLDWTNDANTGFAQTLLPHGAAPAAPVGAGQFAHPATLDLELMTVNAAAPAGVQPNGLYSLNVSNGLLQSFVGSNGHPTLVLRPNHLCFSVMTVVPTTQITAGASDSTQVLYKLPDSADNKPASIPVRPVNVTLSDSNLNLQLTYQESGDPVTFCDVFTTTAAFGAVPAAKWGPLLSDPAGAPDHMSKLVEGQLLGLQTVQLNGPVLTPTGTDLLQIDVTQAFVDDPIHDVLPLTTAAPTDTPPTADDNLLATIAQTLMAPDVVCLRQAIFNSLQNDFGLAAGTDGPLTALAANPAQYLAGNPLHC